jgi:hypothetical protein
MQATMVCEAIPNHIGSSGDVTLLQVLLKNIFALFGVKYYCKMTVDVFASNTYILHFLNKTCIMKTSPKIANFVADRGVGSQDTCIYRVHHF